MRCPSITDLPPPSAPAPGWPWDEQSKPLPETMPDGSPWPRISLVTPSFNQGRFIEQTIRSVLLQGYPDLEYIIIDGSSTDETVSIIQKYAPWLSYWVSEPDDGQSHAINKGMSRAGGEIAAWLNSDDWLETDALATVARAFLELPAGSAGIAGACRWHRGETTEIRRPGILLHRWLGQEVLYGLQQPSTFFRLATFNRIGGVDQKLHYVMDKDLWLRLQREALDFHPLDQVISNFRCHESSKTTGRRPAVNLRAARENFRLRNKFLGSPARPAYWRLAARSLAELALAYLRAAGHAIGRRKETIKSEY